MPPSIFETPELERSLFFPSADPTPPPPARSIGGSTSQARRSAPSPSASRLPIGSNRDERGQRRNRRVEVWVK